MRHLPSMKISLSFLMMSAFFSNLNAKPSSVDLKNGLLKISEDKRFIVHQNGRAFFWLGDIAWELFHRKICEEAEFILRNRAERRLSPHSADGYNRKNLNDFVDRSLRNLGVKAIDLLQLHCPPTSGRVIFQ